ncbi:MAG: cell wall-binding repeat-containing protein [Coriobacteriia bacterium]|nr:cell wall-binding repeat-containing protein [Coriobacteriia bacterium]MBN2821757.1 cell wall-binding repeat-containing protein [Coriobacteriia bacterium]
MRQRHRSGRLSRVLALFTTIALMAAMLPIGPAVAVTVAPPGGTTWYVDAAASADGSGTEADPFRSIGAALSAAEDGDSVEVAPGTYGAYESFPLRTDGKSIDIYSTGGSAQTIIDGGGTNSSVIYAYGGDLGLEGFTVTGADIEGLVAMVAGSGITLRECFAELSDLVVTGNNGYQGAGLNVGDSEVYIVDSIISDNGQYPSLSDGEARSTQLYSDGTDLGGGVFIEFSCVEFQGCEVTGNRAGTAGAGVYVRYGELFVEDSLIADNAIPAVLALESASVWDEATVIQASSIIPEMAGGGVCGLDSMLQFDETTFSGNEGELAAISAIDSGLSMSGCVVSDHNGFAAVGTFGDYAGLTSVGLEHTAPEWPEDGTDPGAVNTEDFYGSSTFVEKTLFIRNTCETAWFAIGGYTLIANSIFAGNEIEFPTVAMTDTYGDIVNCTLADNGSLWGLWSVGDYADVYVTSSIIWDGVSDDSDVASQGSIPMELGSSVYYSGALGMYYDDLRSAPQTAEFDVASTNGLVWYHEEGLIYDDPRFMDAADGDYRLSYGSPCVDVAYDEWGPFEDFTGTYRPIDGDGDGMAVPDMGAYEYTPTGRVGGPNRYDTAIQAVEQNFDTAETVVLATGEHFPDGLTASALCGVYDAPLLLTPRRTLYPAVVDEIVRLGASRVIIVGGDSAVNDAVEDALVDLDLDVTRIGGRDRYETAALIAEHVIANSEFEGNVFIARGDQFADALAASPVAYANRMPILLVGPQMLPTSTVEVLYDYDVSGAAVLGANEAVDVRVESGIQLSLGVPTERIGGRDRYETAALIARWASDAGLAEFSTVGVATGQDFPDALCGGPGIGTRGGVLLLTAPDALSPAAASELTDHREDIIDVQYFGRTLALSTSVQSEVEAIVRPPR